MPYVSTSDALNIRYEVHDRAGPDTPTVVLHHAFGCRIETWHAFGYVEALASRYRVVLYDARGHGGSDKPHDPEAYTPERRVDDVLRVLSVCGIESAHHFGYSMGGRVALTIGALHPDRCRSVIAGGATLSPGAAWSVFRDVDGRDEEAFLRAFEQANREPANEMVRSLLLDNDLRALAASVRDSRPADVDGARWSVPTLLLVGSADAIAESVRRAARELALAELVEIPGHTHFSAWPAIEEMLPPIEEFIRRVESEPEPGPAPWSAQTRGTT